ncbi:hypothetical protein D3C76_963820 [compost metagenome]
MPITSASAVWIKFSRKLMTLSMPFFLIASPDQRFKLITVSSISALGSGPGVVEVTVTSIVVDFPSSEMFISAVPSDTAFTSPVEVTVATCGMLLTYWMSVAVVTSWVSFVL